MASSSHAHQAHPHRGHLAHKCSFSPDRQDPYLRLGAVTVFVGVTRSAACGSFWTSLGSRLCSIPCAIQASAYATVFFAEYDDKAARLRYANCGHLAALLLRPDGGVESLDSTCTAVGLFKDFNCVAAERNLFPGDILALYTDGVTEAFNEAGEEFGPDRLVGTLCRYRHLSSHALLGHVVEETRRFGSQEQHDDITLVVARCKQT